jgi:hypothetical protein
MKVTVGKRFSPPYRFAVILTQKNPAGGTQRFSLDFQGTKAEALWTAKMFRKAIRNHDKAVAARICGKK